MILLTYYWKIEREVSMSPKITSRIYKKAVHIKRLGIGVGLAFKKKFAVLSLSNDNRILNKKTELISRCRHNTK